MTNPSGSDDYGTPRCVVDGCDHEVTVWTEHACEDRHGSMVDAMVPLCRDHGPKAGGAV